MTDWKDALEKDAKRQGYRVDDSRPEALYVGGVPFKQDNGSWSKFDLRVERAVAEAGHPQGRTHQAWLTGLIGRIVQTSQGPLQQSDGEIQLSLKRGRGTYEDIYDQALFYVVRLAGSQSLNASPEERWRGLVADSVVAVIGAGGTGMHIIDLLSKCGINRIEVWDADVIEERNTYRWPGSHRRWMGKVGHQKALAAVEEYAGVDTEVVANCEMVTDANAALAVEADYVFVATGDEGARRAVLEACANAGKPCIECGLGVKVRPGKGEAEGAVRVYLYGEGEYTALTTPSTGNAQGDYEAMIVPDANALNAAIAVTEWRRIAGQYPRYSRAVAVVKYNLVWGTADHEERK